MNNVGSRSISSFAGSSGVGAINSGRDERWGLILAGGDGSRLLPLTRKIAGDERPKQFCRILGGRTLLDETRQRVEITLSPLRTMFALTHKHERFYNAPLDDVPQRNLIVQPRNSGTAPAILYSLLRLQRASPGGSVAFFPSDHYFSNDRAFMAQVEFAFDTTLTQPDLITLLGIEPENPEEEYGWIEPGLAFSTIESADVWRVHRFWEKPSKDLASDLMNRGCLWNSFVMVGKISAFLRMIRLATPELFARFAAVRSSLYTPEEPSTISNLYDRLPNSNFSQDVLAARTADLAVIPVRGSKWSDLGSPGRVLSTMSEIGVPATPKHAGPKISTNFPAGSYERRHSSEFVGS